MEGWKEERKGGRVFFVLLDRRGTYSPVSTFVLLDWRGTYSTVYGYGSLAFGVFVLGKVHMHRWKHRVEGGRQ